MYCIWEVSCSDAADCRAIICESLTIAVSVANLEAMLPYMLGRIYTTGEV